MGVGYYIINYTRRQYFYLGSGTPYSVSAPLKYASDTHGWTLDDHIVTTDDQCYEEDVFGETVDGEDGKDTFVNLPNPDGWTKTWYLRPPPPPPRL